MKKHLMFFAFLAAFLAARAAHIQVDFGEVKHVYASVVLAIVPAADVRL